jgi:hypothetical protein
VNGLSALLLLTGLWTIGAAQQIYDETYHYDFGGGHVVNNNNDDDLLADAIASFHQRWRMIPVWFVPAQLVKVACALAGVFYGRTSNSSTSSSSSRTAKKSSTTNGDDDRTAGIAWLAMAAGPFAFDFGLAVGLRRFDRAVLSFGCLLPHLMLIERQLQQRHRHRQRQQHSQRPPPRNDSSPSLRLVPCHHQEQYWDEAAV